MKNQPHILYAEDDPDTRELVQLFLRQAGFRVSVTGDSSEVLSLLATDHIDALLLDNWMPGISGLELCHGIRAFDQTMPILFCSGAVTEADKKAALSAGAQGYIGKPFDPEDLIATLRAALNIQTTYFAVCGQSLVVCYLPNRPIRLGGSQTTLQASPSPA